MWYNKIEQTAIFHLMEITRVKYQITASDDQTAKAAELFQIRDINRQYSTLLTLYFTQGKSANEINQILRKKNQSYFSNTLSTLQVLALPYLQSVLELCTLPGPDLINYPLKALPFYEYPVGHIRQHLNYLGREVILGDFLLLAETGSLERIYNIGTQVPLEILLFFADMCLLNWVPGRSENLQKRIEAQCRLLLDKANQSMR